MMYQAYPSQIMDLLKKPFLAHPIDGEIPLAGIVEDFRWTRQTVDGVTPAGEAREYLGIQLRIRPEYPHKPFWSTPISSGVLSEKTKVLQTQPV